MSAAPARIVWASRVSRVVVGVDGSEQSLRALRLGLEQARLRREGLVAVTAWQTPMALTPHPMYIDPQEFERAAEAILDEALAAVSSSCTSVTIERSIVKGDARLVLLADLADEDLLVIGTRGLGGVSSLLLGSVASHCISHAPCPVLVVPAAVGPGP